jgi:hypothetical protein
MYFWSFASRGLGCTRTKRWRTIYGLFLVTAVLWLLTDGVEALMYAEVLPNVPSGEPLDFLWRLPFVSLVAAGCIRELSFSAAQEKSGDEEGAPTS